MKDFSYNEVLFALNKDRKENEKIELKLNDETQDYEFVNPKDCDYGTICYLIALNIAHKAEVLQEKEGITGFQHGYIAGIAKNLIDNVPITPIEDNEGEWTEIVMGANGAPTIYQAKRASSLFKYVYDDGTVKYSDCDRFVYREDGATWNCKLLGEIAEKYYGPITFPYMPGSKNRHVFEAITFNSINGEPGSYDTMVVYDMKGETLYITDDGDPLSYEEFMKRYEQYRQAAEKAGFEVKKLKNSEE